ncbi:prominin-2 [Hypomesus transpacificus]|uniref:prominin-2 n=1 Tax=Hypomesus transpacificus TaxID=137520 RepID=UPI001F0756F3|nr:prominin-2 [Hypomesus transpacificus]
MGLHRNLWRSWRLEASARMFQAWLGVLLLGLSIAQPAPSPVPCPSGSSPMGLNHAQYQDTPKLDTDLGFMSGVVQSFLHTVQPNPFPKDLVLKAVQDPNTLSDQETIKEFLVYEVGFLVCAAIGILYIVLMPLVGFIMACCRCCGNCGGRMYQQQTSSLHCHRRGLYCCTFITTLILLAGNICMFRSNESLKVSVDHVTVEINNTLDNLHTYLITLPKEVDHVLNESYKTVDEVSNSLNAIGPLLGKEIQKALEGPLNAALQSVRDVAQVANSTNVLLGQLNLSLSAVMSRVAVVQANVSAVKERLNRTLSNPDCVGCAEAQPELERLNLDTSLATPNIGELQSAVDKVNKADLNSKVKEGETFFQNIPQRVTNDTKDAVKSVKKQLEDIKSQISKVTSDIPVSTLNNLAEELGQAMKYVGQYKPETERAEHIRGSVFLVLCCLVLLVVVCNLMGLILGPVGLRPKADPMERSGTSECGGSFFMIGAGLSFLFSWLFMLLVLVLFLLGGNVYTLVCQPWHNGKLLQLVDTPGLIPGFNLSETLGLKSNLTLTEVYKDCEQDMPLWSTLHLYELINLNDLLNVSKYTEQIQQNFEGNDINLPTITLLTPETRSQLSSFSSMAKDIDFFVVTQQINNMSRININTTADNLDSLATPQPNLTIQAELRTEAADLRRIQNDIDTTIIPQLENLNSTIQALHAIATQVNGTVENVLRKVGTAQDFLNTNTSLIIKNESRRFVDCQMGYFITYADWANMTITQQVGRCGPVAQAVDTAEVIVCSYMVESLNAFWFSLGWCMLFFIPSIIFSIKLAKYYRKMDQGDIFENDIAMNHIPRAQVKPY